MYRSAYGHIEILSAFPPSDNVSSLIRLPAAFNEFGQQDRSSSRAYESQHKYVILEDRS